MAHPDRNTSADAPAVSVVMPAYNAEKYIARAIDSILGQTLTDLELIVGEDRSTDRTWQIVNEYAARDSRVRAFRNEENMGAAATINRAVAMARAPLIAGMDADDISVPTRLEKQVEFLRAMPETAVVGSYVSHINEDDETLSLSRTGPTSVEEFAHLRRIGEPTMVFGGTAMYPKRLFDAVDGYDSSLRAAADIEFCDRMADHGPVVAITEPLLLYRVYATSNVALRFREGRVTHRFLATRRAARLAGEPLPTREEYVEWERNASPWRKLRFWQDDVSQAFYRRAGMAFAQGKRVETALMLAVAALAAPIRVVRRLWDQRLSPRARRSWSSG